MSRSAISVSDLSKTFRLYHEKNRHLKAAVLRGRRARFEEFWALRDVSLEIPHGATFGLIGSNGSGKSTLLKCMARILFPNKGRVTVSGRLSALLELGAGFHNELSGRENVYLNGAILGMTRKDIDHRFDSIVEFAGLEQFIDSPVKNYSNGMQLRLGFAIAANVEPEILLIDEVLAVGDQAFQRKCAEKIESFKSDGRTIIIVSHGMGSILQLCETTAWLDKGQLKQVGPSPDVITAYTGQSFGAEVATEGALGSRWGTGEAEITNVRLLSKAGEPVNPFVTGEPLVIEIDYEAHRPLRDSVFSLRITSLHGIEIWAANSKRRRHFVERLSSCGKVTITIPNLPLLQGSYSVTAIISDNSEQHIYDWWDKKVRFDVVGDENFDEGLVTMNSLWDLSRARQV